VCVTAFGDARVQSTDLDHRENQLLWRWRESKIEKSIEIKASALFACAMH
jgi:hypothetical protein